MSEYNREWYLDGRCGYCGEYLLEDSTLHFCISCASSSLKDIQECAVELSKTSKNRLLAAEIMVNVAKLRNVLLL